MKMENRSFRMYLEDINLAMERIAEYIHGLSFMDFKQDYKTVDAVIRNFEILGEASKNLPEEFKEKYSTYPGTKCIFLEIKCHMNILALIMRLFGILLRIIFREIKHKLKIF